MTLVAGYLVDLRGVGFSSLSCNDDDSDAALKAIRSAIDFLRDDGNGLANPNAVTFRLNSNSARSTARRCHRNIFKSIVDLVAAYRSSAKPQSRQQMCVLTELGRLVDAYGQIPAGRTSSVPHANPSNLNGWHREVPAVAGQTDASRVHEDPGATRFWPEEPSAASEHR